MPVHAERPKVAMVWRGEPGNAPERHPRLEPIADALTAAGLEVAQVAWWESVANEARAALLTCQGVLVWVDPLTEGRARAQLDPILREVAARGAWVSAHPDVIMKMGVKEVLYRTRNLGWGADTYCYGDVETFRREFPPRLAADRVRVIKQNRGNGSQGVWKVELADPAGPVGADSLVNLVEARGDRAKPGFRLGDFMERSERYLDGEGRIIDQAFQPRVGEGLVRCYMCENRVIGFSEQRPFSQVHGDPTQPPFGMASEKAFSPAEAPRFQRLRRSMEDDWTPGLQGMLDIDARDLPVLWDADFLHGAKTSDGADTYVLCEINISCVIPYPVDAVAVIAEAARQKSVASPAARLLG
ncbi:MAG TPA: Cj0069 family protein [Caulobacteraceae bacterium]